MYDYDQPKITAAAAECSRQLHQAASLAPYRDDFPIAGRVTLEPGDATAYEIVVIAPTHPILGKHFLVCLATGFGASYEWTGSAMHADYCGEKWAHSSRRSTGEVMSRFLSALSPLVQDLKL